MANEEGLVDIDEVEIEALHASAEHIVRNAETLAIRQPENSGFGLRDHLGRFALKCWIGSGKEFARMFGVNITGL